MNCTSTLRQNQTQDWRQSRQAARATSSLQPLLEAGTHVGRCCGWVELGKVAVPDYGKADRSVSAPFQEGQTQKRVLITWLIRGRAGESWRVSREYALAFGPRCGLRKLLEGWRGRAFADDAQARAVDPLRVLEQPGLIVVGYKEGSTWPRVENVLPMLKGLEAEPLKWPPVLFTWAKPDRETFLRLPKWVQRKVRGSVEWGRRAAV